MVRVTLGPRFWSVLALLATASMLAATLTGDRTAAAIWAVGLLLCLAAGERAEGGR